jgi:hypothetical protein
MVPRKPKPKPDDDDRDNNSITVDGKNRTVRLDLEGRGIVLVYAIAFAIVVLSVGFVCYQIITALRVTGGSVRESIGFIVCLLTTFLFACLSR